MKTAIFLAVLTIVCTVIRSSYAQVSKCGRKKFQCRNGECIASALLCDGRPDCVDQSDETVVECTKPEIICNEYAFRCSYGACVDGDATCNGIKDCLDNSDEMLPRCKDVVNNSGNSTECTALQYKCNNGQCIQNRAQCDGTVDCADGSDETFTNCGSFNCPQLVFRCAYGACIDGDLKCNGYNNCADGSDEDPKLCNTSTTMTTSPTFRPVTPVIIPTPTPTPSDPLIPWTAQGCVVPPQPENGNWTVVCSTGRNCQMQQGTLVPPGTHIIYNCIPGYKLSSTAHPFCSTEGKWLFIPVCEEIRCKALSTASTYAYCTYKGQWKSCETSVPPWTIAKLQCRNSYHQDTNFLTSQRTEVTCNENGEWEPDPIQCIPVCGITTTRTKPLIVNGTFPDIGEFPWHATLYRAPKSEDPKEFICGATIIRESILITAAHCVYDESRKRVFPADTFYVATGNIYQPYDYVYEDPVLERAVNKAKVKNIYVKCNYAGVEGNHALDIALLEIETPFVFTSFLRPVCLDSERYGEQEALEEGNLGKIAGFGTTALGAPSFILQSLNVPFIPLSKCRKSSQDYEAQKYFTEDKFCAGYTNGSSACYGDSGGGLVFPTGNLWYLRGIVSVGLGEIVEGGSRMCNSHAYSLYTRVSHHIPWMQNVITSIDSNRVFRQCRDEK